MALNYKPMRTYHSDAELCAPSQGADRHTVTSKGCNRGYLFARAAACCMLVAVGFCSISRPLASHHQNSSMSLNTPKKITHSEPAELITKGPNSIRRSLAVSSERNSRLEELVQGKEIVGDVSWLLDFAVLGFPKCATTFLGDYLETDETYMGDRKEICSMSQNKPHELVSQFYENAPPGAKLGIKCPKEMETEFALDNYAKYFPKTNFVISLRHPVLWFQSFYNFRVRHRGRGSGGRGGMLAPQELIGSCLFCEKGESGRACRSRDSVCTERANFHYAMSRLGKTPMSTPQELELLGHHNMTITPSKAKVFLMDVGEISDENSTRRDILTAELSAFLGLERGLPPIEVREEYKRGPVLDGIKICDAEHEKLRSILLHNGRAASQWIIEYFLASPDVYVASKENFIERLKSWGEDPCDVDLGLSRV